MKCAPGYKYNSKTKTCEPKKGNRVMRFRTYAFGGRPAPKNGNGKNGNGNGNGGNGNGNGGNGNGGGNGSGGNGGGGNGGGQ